MAMRVLLQRQSNGGTITPDTVHVQQGSDQTFQIIPNEGYVISDVLMDLLSQEHTFISKTIFMQKNLHQDIQILRDMLHSTV